MSGRSILLIALFIVLHDERPVTAQQNGETLEALQNVDLREGPPSFRLFYYSLGNYKDTVKKGEQLRITEVRVIGAGNQKWLRVSRLASEVAPAKREGWVLWASNRFKKR